MPPMNGTDVRTVARSNNHFAFDLYQQVRTEGGNLFLSPFSVSTALAMTYAGARGETADEMKRTLRVPLDSEALDSAYASLLARLGGSGGANDDVGYRLAIANRLWGDQRVEFLEAFRSRVATSYGAAVERVDFHADSEGARRRINTWVEEQTRGKIRDLFAPGSINEATSLALANAIYFKGKWSEPFEPSQTRERPFHSRAGTVNVPMMHRRSDFMYGEASGVQMLQIPYRGDTIVMCIALPREPNGLDALEQRLDATTFDGWIAALQIREVDASIPKLRIESSFGLSEPLRQLGMRRVFEPANADLSGMNGQRDLFIGAAVHKAFVEVNEEGTEAAAATGFAVAGAAAPATPVTFTADHPFLFFIRDLHTGSILFMGRVENPRG